MPKEPGPNETIRLNMGRATRQRGPVRAGSLRLDCGQKRRSPATIDSRRLETRKQAILKARKATPVRAGTSYRLLPSGWMEMPGDVTYSGRRARATTANPSFSSSGTRRPLVEFSHDGDEPGEDCIYSERGTKGFAVAALR